jgi:hypothetical protein
VVEHEVDLQYDTTDKLSCGVQVKAGSRTVSWNIDSYLDDLERQLRDDLALPASSSALQEA